jgi:hypothetical protein
MSNVQDEAFLHILELLMDLEKGYLIPEVFAESGIVSVYDFLSLNEDDIDGFEYEEIQGVGFIRRLTTFVASSIYATVQFVRSKVILSDGTIDEGQILLTTKDEWKNYRIRKNYPARISAIRNSGVKIMLSKPEQQLDIIQQVMSTNEGDNNLANCTTPPVPNVTITTPHDVNKKLSKENGETLNNNKYEQSALAYADAIFRACYPPGGKVSNKWRKFIIFTI